MGKLEVHDGDSGDSVSLHLRGPYARIFKGNLLWGIDNKSNKGDFSNTQFIL